MARHRKRSLSVFLREKCRGLIRRLVRWTFRAAAGFVLLSLFLVLPLRWLDPPTSAFMISYRIFEEHRGAGAPIRHRWVDLGDIGKALPLAVVAAEDQKFPGHHGFDLESITDAVQERLRGDRLRGASTITQQTAKNLFLWPGRNLVRKGLEAWFTVLLETCWTKTRILEVYLNVAEFGRGVYGAGAAARHFFGKPPAGLKPSEAAVLAAVLPSPRRLHAGRPSVYVLSRSLWIRGQMQLLGPEYLSGICAAR